MFGVDAFNYGHTIFAANDNALINFEKYTNQSLYPGLGLSDLYRTNDDAERLSHKGATECAIKCFDDPACVAFHHWRERPDDDDDNEDYCFYWSKNNHSDNTYTTLDEALGAGDEGQGTGYVVDAYIKKEIDCADTNQETNDDGTCGVCLEGYVLDEDEDSDTYEECIEEDNTLLYGGIALATVVVLALIL
jgi:hypothetical protein